jgi:hypothetical protein
MEHGVGFVVLPVLPLTVLVAVGSPPFPLDKVGVAVGMLKLVRAMTVGSSLLEVNEHARLAIAKIKAKTINRRIGVWYSPFEI